jgi:hypothetical protein
MIRKIIVGVNPKDALAYVVGNHAGNDGTIVAIEVDERTFAKYGRKDYVIYIQNADGTMPWKEIIGMPVVVENDCKF